MANTEWRKQQLRFWMKQQMDMSLTEGARQFANSMVHVYMDTSTEDYFEED